MDIAQEPSNTTLWPLWAAIGMPLLLIVLNATPVAPNFVFVMIGIPVLFCIWGVLGVWAFVLTIRHMARCQWSHTMLSAVLPLAILPASIWHLQFLHLCNDAGDIGYFIAERSSYLHAIHDAPLDGEPRLLVFNRGGISWASRGYVYDENDEITREKHLRSAKWTAQADATELTCGYYAQPFPGRLSFTRHWYLASFSC